MLQIREPRTGVRGRRRRRIAGSSVPGTVAPSGRRCRIGTPYFGWRTALALLGLCAVYLVLACSSLRLKSVTIDEFGHLPAGLNLLTSGDFRYCYLNPPLMNALSALPLELSGVKGVYPKHWPQGSRFDFWVNGYVFMNQHGVDYHDLFVRSRYVSVAIVALLGFVGFLWGRLLVPERSSAAGLLTAALIWFSPNVMSHARLVTTDAGMAFFMVLSLFTLFLFVRRPTWARSLACGVALGLAQLVKFTAVLLYPAHLLVILIFAVQQPRAERRRVGLQILLIFAVSLLTLNLGYGFQGSMKAVGDLGVESDLVATLAHSLPSFTRVPLPEDYVLAFDRQLVEAEIGSPSFLFGESYTGGRWYYFLALLALKIPLPTLILAILAFYLAMTRKLWRGIECLVLVLPAAAMFAVFSFFSEKQIGLRMILPVIVIAYVWVGASLARVRWSRGLRVLIALNLAWLGVEVLRIHPDYLTYFNQLAGGPENGYRYAADSNVDWGQDLIKLKEYTARAKTEEIQLLYFGRVDPAIYGIDYRVPLHGLQPGYLAVSRSLYARSYFLFDHDRIAVGGLFKIPTGSGIEKVATLGNSIDVYRVSRSLPALGSQQASPFSMQRKGERESASRQE